MGSVKEPEGQPAAAQKDNGKTSQSLHLPVRVIFEDGSDGPAQEIARTIYVSANKAIIPLRRELPVGALVRLVLPLPASWRRHSYLEAVYVTPAEVVSAESEDGVKRTLFHFISDREALRRRREREKAGAPARVEKVERRRETRLPIPIEMTLERLDDSGGVISTEPAVTENLSRGGARLMTSGEVCEGDIVRLTASREGFQTRAVVMRASVGPDHIRRVHVQFIDAVWKV